MGAGTDFVLILLAVGCVAAVSVVFLAGRGRSRRPPPAPRVPPAPLATPAAAPPPTAPRRRPPGPERRSQLRRHVAQPVALRRARPDAPVERSFAFDLSPGGMQLAGPASLPVGEFVWVALDTPDAGRIDVNARVVHETPQGHKGLRFEHVDPANLQALRRLLGPA
jgi:hypothetical protein